MPAWGVQGNLPFKCERKVPWPQGCRGSMNRMTNLLPATQRALLRRLATEQSENRVPSLIAGLVRDGKTVWTGTRGVVEGEPATADTQYRIGSITKTFVAVLVMRLRDEGLLNLSDPIDKYVPGTAAENQSIARLLSHSSALSAEPAGEWWERTAGVAPAQFVSKLTATSLRPNPQHVFHYSNTGYGLLGELVARLRGVSWEVALRREILDPLGMNRTTLEPVVPHARGWAVHPWADVVQPEPAEDARAMAPAGQLWSTVNDMCRWLRFLCGEVGEVLHPDTLTEMRTPVSVNDGDEWAGGAGLGLQLFRHKGRRLAGHSGSMPGFLAIAVGDPDQNTGAVFLANTTAGVSSGLATDLLDLLDENEPRIPDAWHPDPNVDMDLLELTGQWYWGPAPFVMRILPEGLLDLAPMRGNGRASRFRRISENTWVGLDGYYAGEKLQIGRAEDGVVTHLNLNSFIFTRTPYDAVAPVPGGTVPWQPGN